MIVLFQNGVLTLQLGHHGTWVINKQTPNLQIWYSSPVSGPQRFEFCTKSDCWIQKHNKLSLHNILFEEISKVFPEISREEMFHSAEYQGNS